MNPSFPQSVQLATGPGGFPRFEVNSPLAQADVYLHGAHIAHYAPAGEAPLLFLSRQSYYEAQKPIRGGVPVVFPWFGERPEGGPAHGFARLRSWAAETVSEESDGTVTLVLRLNPDEETTRLWRGDWVLRHRITIGRTLAMELQITNTGSTPLECEEALHTYFAVHNVREIDVAGLENAEYLTVIEDAPRKRQDGEPIRFRRETDRAYINTESDLAIHDPGFSRTIVIRKSQSRSTVVWNPWSGKARAMVDFDENEWPSMVCVETGNLKDNRLVIEPGTTHSTRTELITRPLSFTRS